MIGRLLIANRGEIAIRVMKTCRRLGITSIAVYSDADAAAPHVAAADLAVRIGAAPAADSYLNMAHVLGAARQTAADAIHPGYGFLSENPEFADACEAAGIIFVGPSAAVIRQMGSKTHAREIVSSAGVPIVPGADAASQDVGALSVAVAKVGFPALIKASAGGGGKGMRLVRTPADVEEALAAARGEAQRSFGDGTLYVERLIEHARHIEVQIMGDRHGHVVHVGDRDCSLQRRHQKVIEEAPAPGLAPAVRQRMADAAVRAAAAVGYVGAGTIEFLLEGQGDTAHFYFLEMNTRLQVEHPITEAITGLDLVEAQLRVAAGDPLPWTQEAITTRGHAFECRVYAEDARRLLPQAGRLIRYREPVGPGVRVDSGVAEGHTVTVDYDPLLAKVIVHAGTRDEARTGALAALGDFEILGLRHNVAFLRRLLSHPTVAASGAHTSFIDNELPSLTAPVPDDVVRAAMAIAARVRGTGPAPKAPAATSGSDPWASVGDLGW